jgi:tetratricopeptide (TPR) repeat protein
MKSSHPQNAITEQLERMNRLWERFRSLPEARVCRWLIQQDEKQMINAFFETSYLEDNPLTDFFIPFYTACIDFNSYSDGLIKELQAKIEFDREAMEAEGIHISWIPKAFGNENEQEFSYFLNNFYSFSQEAPSGELLVAVFMPDQVNRQFVKWLTGVLSLKFPDNLRMLVIEQIDEVRLDKLATAYPKLVITTSLELDMPNAIKQLASAGDPADPGVKFRKAFLDLSQAAANKNFNEVQRLELPALNIAREQGWVPMEIAVHSLVASGYIGLNQLQNALQRYNQAYSLAKKAHAAGERVALTLAIQCLFNKGSVYIAEKDFAEAANAYGTAATHALEANDHYQTMEAKRMQGFCLEKNGEWEQAFEVEKEALTAAEQLEENVRHNSTLPYLGQSLLELSYRNGDKEGYIFLEEKLDALAGPGWQNKLQSNKAAVL